MRKKYEWNSSSKNFQKIFFVKVIFVLQTKLIYQLMKVKFFTILGKSGSGKQLF